MYSSQKIDYKKSKNYIDVDSAIKALNEGRIIEEHIMAFLVNPATLTKEGKIPELENVDKN